MESDVTIKYPGSSLKLIRHQQTGLTFAEISLTVFLSNAPSLQQRTLSVLTAISVVLSSHC
jgi:hypothetical protein